MASNKDLTYINQILSGDLKAFSKLVNDHKDMVYTLAYRMIKNRESAEEAAQDTFMKVYRSLNKFKAESKFSTWIYKITYNTCLDKIKVSRREQRLVSQDQSIEELTDLQLNSTENALETLEEEEQKEMIKGCLEMLSPDDSVLLTLFYFEDLSVKEIADILSINQSNVKVRLFRSRKKLTSILRQRLDVEVIKYYEK